MGIKIKYRNPSLNEFDVKDLVVNVNEGSLWFKTHNHLYRILGNIEQTTIDAHPGNETRNPNQPSYWVDNDGDADIHIGSQLGLPGTSGSKARLALQPYSHTGGPFNFVTRDTPNSAYIDIDYGLNSKNSTMTISHYNSVGIGAKNPVTASYLHIRADGGILNDHRDPSFGNGQKLYSGSYLVIEGNSSHNHNCIQMIGSSSGQTSIWFGDEDFRASGRVRYQHNNDSLELWAAGANVASFSASGTYKMMGIGKDIGTHTVRSTDWRFLKQGLTTPLAISASGGFYSRGKHFISDVDGASTGWKTIAICDGGRAAGKFLIEDRESGRHISLIFYATHMYGSNNSHNSGGTDGGNFNLKKHHGDSIQVLSYARYGTSPISAIRIKSWGVYDGAVIQAYVSQTNNYLSVKQIETHQDPGWHKITDWVDDSTDPGMNFGGSSHSTTTYASFKETTRVNLDHQGGPHVSLGSYDSTVAGPWIETGMAAFSKGAAFGESQIGGTTCISASLLLAGHISMSLNRGIGYNITTGNEYIMYPRRTGLQSLAGLGSNLAWSTGMSLESDEQITLVETDNNTVRGVFDVNNNDFIWDGDIEYGGTLGQSSDRRLKENIYTLTGSLNKVLDLEGVSFNWKNKKDKGEETRYGLIAQDVQKILPNLVKTSIIPDENMDKTLTVNYIELIPYLIESIKDQQKQIDELKAKLNE